MSVQYILNPTYSYVENDKLNQELEVSTSLKAPIHYVEDLTISKTVGGNMSLGAPVVEATQLEAPIAVLDTINTEELIPKSGTGGDITVDGNLDFGAGTTSGIKNISYLQVEGATPVPGYVLSALDSFGTLGWVPDATGSTPTIQQVLQAGNDAGGEQLANIGNITGTTIDLGKEGQFGRIILTDSTPTANITISGEYGGYINVNAISSNTGDNLVLTASGGVSTINLESDVIVDELKSLQVKNIKDKNGALGTAGQVLKKSSDNSGVEWLSDAVGAPTLSDVLLNGNSAGSTSINMNNQNISAVNTLSATIVDGTTVKANSLTTSNPSQTQINVGKNLNLSSNILYAGTINAGDTITSKNTLFGVEPNRWTGFDSYTLKQLDGNNVVQSDSGADLIGWHDVQSKRGKFTAIDASNVERFSATGDGAVSCVGLTTSKINIPSQTPTVGQVLGASNVDGSISWINNTVDVPTLAEVLAEGNSAGAYNINMNDKKITNINELAVLNITEQVLSTGVNFNATVDLNDNVLRNVLQMSVKDIQHPAGGAGTIIVNSSMDFEANNITDVGTMTSQVVEVEELKEKNTGVGIYVKSYLDMDNNTFSNANMVRTAQLQSQDQVSNIVSLSGMDFTNPASRDIIGTRYVSADQFLPTYKPERTLWVSPNNTYATPNGSYENPYTTIQAAITYAESVYDNTYWYINVLPGTYAGFTATKKVFVKGMAPSNPDGCSVGCQITSDITVAFDSNDGDMFNNQCSLSGFLIAGAKIVDSSTARHVLNITDCYLYNDSGTGRLIDCRPTSTDCRLQVFNSKVVNVSASAGDPMVELSVGMARFYQTQFQCAGVQNVVKFSGTSRVDSIVLCSFTSTNASAVLPPIIEITSSTLSPFTFGNCSFVYTSNTNKSANPSSCAIYGNASATPTILTVVYSTFSLAGTTDPSNHIINYNAVPSTTYYYSNGAIPGTCHRINGNKTSLIAVV